MSIKLLRVCYSFWLIVVIRTNKILVHNIYTNLKALIKLKYIKKKTFKNDQNRN